MSYVFCVQNGIEKVLGISIKHHDIDSVLGRFIWIIHSKTTFPPDSQQLLVDYQVVSWDIVSWTLTNG